MKNYEGMKVYKKKGKRSMKALKKVAATTALVMGMTTMASCGSKTVSMPQEAKDIAKLATERTAELKSYELNGSMGFAVEAMDQKLDLDVTIDMVYFKDPMKMKMDMKMVDSTGEVFKEEVTTSMYFMKEDNNYVNYVEAEGQWTKTVLDAEDEANKKLIEQMENGMTTMDESLYDLYTKSADQPENETSLDFVITGEHIVDMLEKSGVDTSALEASGVSTDIFAQIGEIPMTMTVDNENVYWKSVSVDLTEMVQNLLDTLLAQYGALLGEEEVSVKVGEIKMDLSYNKYNEAEDFTLPEEAKNAQEISTDILGEYEDSTSSDVEVVEE